VSNPYPNPVRGGALRVDLESPCPKNVRWSVFSVAYRKIAEGSLVAEGRTSILWDLRDTKGKPVAPGLYHFTVEGEGLDAKTMPVLVIR